MSDERRLDELNSAELLELLTDCPLYSISNELTRRHLSELLEQNTRQKAALIHMEAAILKVCKASSGYAKTFLDVFPLIKTQEVEDAHDRYERAFETLRTIAANSIDESEADRNA